MKLRLGIVGLGEVAQLIHLPILSRLAERFELTEAYDPSASVARTVAARWGIGKLHSTVESLIGSDATDAIMVLSPDPYHGQHGREVLAAGKHLFLEKPACLTIDDLHSLSAAYEQSDKTAMIGYMRRYAPAFVKAKQLLPSLGEITYVRVRDVICEGPWYFAQTDRVVEPTGDVPEELISEGRQLRADMVQESVGLDPASELGAAYSVLTGLSSHSFSAMRDLLGGPPIRVISATVRQGGQQISALFDYGSFVALYECLISDVVRFEAGIEINSQSKRLSIKYPTPYIRNLPMELEVQTSSPHANETIVHGPFHEDPFQAELIAFHASCISGEPTRTPPSDSLADLKLFQEVIRAAEVSK